jgi:hypothetical protein
MTDPRHLFLLVACLFFAPHGAGAITDLSGWTLLQDPPNALMTGTSTSGSATLVAGSGSIPAGTDIGFASVDANTPAVSGAGHYFSAGTSFSLSINYDLSFVAGSGLVAIGFGIGEDAAGVDSAGATLFANNGAASFVAGTARSGDVNLAPNFFALSPSLVGTMFVAFNHGTGDVTVGAASGANAAVAESSHTFTADVLAWDGTDLLVSFFLRSDAVPPLFGSAWNGQNATAVFSGLSVLSGAPLPVPEPGVAWLGAIGWGLLAARRRRG